MRKKRLQDIQEMFQKKTKGVDVDLVSFMKDETKRNAPTNSKSGKKEERKGIIATSIKQWILNDKHYDLLKYALDNKNKAIEIEVKLLDEECVNKPKGIHFNTKKIKHNNNFDLQRAKVHCWNQYQHH